MHIIGSLLERTQISFRTRQPDLVALVTLLNTDMFDEIIPTSIDLKTINFEVCDNLSIRIRFTAWKASPTTKVFHVIGFRHWGNLLDEPVLYDYDGPKFVVYNAETQCVKSIDEPVAVSYIMEDCKSRNDSETNLDIWKVVAKGEPKSIPIKTEFKASKPMSVIYCFTQKIKIASGEAQACPPHAFYINSTLPWETSDRRKYSPEITQYVNVSMSLEMGEISHILFNQSSHFFDSGEAISKLQEVKKTFDKTVGEQAEKSNRIRNLTLQEISHLQAKSTTHLFGYQIWIRDICIFLLLVCSLFFIKTTISILVKLSEGLNLIKKGRKDSVLHKQHSRVRAARRDCQAIYENSSFASCSTALSGDVKITPIVHLTMYDWCRTTLRAGKKSF